MNSYSFWHGRFICVLLAICHSNCYASYVVGVVFLIGSLPAIHIAAGNHTESMMYKTKIINPGGKL